MHYISEDGSASFGGPIVIDHVCGLTRSVENSHLAVDSTGILNVACEEFTNFPTGKRQLRFTTFPRRTKMGMGPYVVVDQIVGGGDTFQLEGTFVNIYGLDLAVDRSGGDSDGTVYVTWDDGRNMSVPDFFSQTGTYAFDDILLRYSLDGGMTWGAAPIKVNSDSDSGGRGHDHYQPAIAVDGTGKVAVCWYDRRDDPDNLAISRWCATSIDSAVTWRNAKVKVPSFGPAHGTDALVNPSYMGHYDGLTSDFISHAQDFIGTFQFMRSRANPDVKAVIVH